MGGEGHADGGRGCLLARAGGGVLAYGGHGHSLNPRYAPERVTWVSMMWVSMNCISTFIGANVFFFALASTMNPAMRRYH